MQFLMSVICMLCISSLYSMDKSYQEEEPGANISPQRNTVLAHENKNAEQKKANQFDYIFIPIIIDWKKQNSEKDNEAVKNQPANKKRGSHANSFEHIFQHKGFFYNENNQIVYMYEIDQK